MRSSDAFCSSGKVVPPTEALDARPKLPRRLSSFDPSADPDQSALIVRLAGVMKQAVVSSHGAPIMHSR
jgi:hypothetical protein